MFKLNTFNKKFYVMLTVLFSLLALEILLVNFIMVINWPESVAVVEYGKRAEHALSIIAANSLLLFTGFVFSVRKRS